MTMPKRSLLLTLPICLAADILNSWLVVSDRAKLDSAHCSHGNRPSFLTLLRSPECSVKSWVYDRGWGRPTNKIIAWANVRGVQVEKISLGSNSDLDIFETYLQKFGSGVHVVHMCAATTRALTILSNCPNLVRLDCILVPVNSSLADVLRTCPKLRELRLVFSRYYHSSVPPDPLTSDDLEGIVCPNLKLLSLVRCSESAVVTALVKLAVQVQVLALYKCDTEGALHADILQHISPTVMTLSLTQVESIPEDVFCAMIERCAYIVHLDLSGSTVSNTMATALGTLKLQSIGLSYADISDDAFLALVEAQSSTLREILVGRLSLETMLLVLHKCTKLDILNTQCVDEDDYKLDLSVCSKLTSFSVVYQGNRQSEFLTQISEHCVSLHQLQLNLSKIDFSVEKIDAIVERCTQLSAFTLEVRNSDEMYIAENEERWKAARPGLVVTDMFTSKLTALNEVD